MPSFKILNQLALGILGDTPLSFGKYKGRTYKELSESEEGRAYLRYLAKSENSSTALPAKFFLKNRVDI